MVYRSPTTTDPEELAAERYAAEGYGPDPYQANSAPPPARRGGLGDLGRLADDFLDDLLPEELDWRRLVGTYPKTALGIACLGGFLLGRSHGKVLVLAAKGALVAELTRAAEDAVGGLVE